MIRLLMAIGLALMTAQAFAQVQVPKSYSDGEVIDAEELNNNLKAIADAVPPRDCTTDQIIKWDGSAWVCVTEPITAYFVSSDIGETVDLSRNLASSICNETVFGMGPNDRYFSCDFTVQGVYDHNNCVVQAMGVPCPDCDITVATETTEVQTGGFNKDTEAHVTITCLP